MAAGDQTQYLVNNVTSTGGQPPNAQAGPPLPLGGQQPAPGTTNMAGNLVTNVTNANSGPRQLTSLPDLMGMGGTPTAPASAGQSYSYSPDQLQAIIKKYQDVLQTLMQAAQSTTFIGMMDPPADEDASKEFTQKALGSGRAFRQANQQSIEYVSGEIDKLKAVLQQYNQAEEANAEQARRIHRNL
ncbi:hypothetical protein [Gandjariella thermophila]|uniref:PE domain-containing protein n=1 Tax=Gandjariella thermophila TaxID=1931992 RepID=A0A4D4J6H3_9PSEU|nr:hypothetical protein [Gandjariella thermophila]GDY30650.1 hypothetical protein GTS_22830 [Gandjariella thermophila]